MLPRMLPKTSFAVGSHRIRIEYARLVSRRKSKFAYRSHSVRMTTVDLKSRARNWACGFDSRLGYLTTKGFTSIRRNIDIGILRASVAKSVVDCRGIAANSSIFAISRSKNAATWVSNGFKTGADSSGSRYQP